MIAVRVFPSGHNEVTICQVQWLPETRTFEIIPDTIQTVAKDATDDIDRLVKLALAGVTPL